jgi:hypothetical protein
MSKRKKKRALYLIAYRPEEQAGTYVVAELKFLVEIPPVSGNGICCSGLQQEISLSYPKLSYLIEDFIFNCEEDGAPDVNLLRRRANYFFSDFMVVKVNLQSPEVSILPDHMVRSCFRSILESLNRSVKKEAVQRVDHPPFRNAEPDFINLFITQLDRCFGKHTSGILTFSSANEESGKWDVEKNAEGEFIFGTNRPQHALFLAKLRRFFEEGCAVCVRIFTDQYSGGLPFKELYAFVLTADFKMINMDYLTVEKAYNTDHRTLKELKPEKNVVYCDLNNNKLGSFDLE